MAVSEFVEVMTDILHAGGIDHIEYGVRLKVEYYVVSSRAFVWASSSRS